MQENIEESNAYTYGFINAMRIQINHELELFRLLPWYNPKKWFFKPAIKQVLDFVNSRPSVMERGYFYYDDELKTVSFHWEIHKR